MVGCVHYQRTEHCGKKHRKKERKEKSRRRNCQSFPIGDHSLVGHAHLKPLGERKEKKRTNQSLVDQTGSLLFSGFSEAHMIIWSEKTEFFLVHFSKLAIFVDFRCALKAT